MEQQLDMDQCNHRQEEDGEEKRQLEERRQKDSCGFACISTVGWICRRERTRRKDDTCPW